MSLTVDIEKSLGSFKLAVQLDCGDETVALLGASGCGKSMTLRCIAGIEHPDRGKIILDGVTLFDSDRKINLSPQERRTGILFQSYALFPNMTVWGNLRAGIRDRKGTDPGEVIRSAITRFKLEGLEKHLPSQLSGGQQQRVALARILVSSPRILMLDEPFSALDSHLRVQMETEVTEIIRGFGGTALFVSHNRDEVYRVCDRIAVIEDGRVAVMDEKHALFENPRTFAAARLTGCKNISAANRLGGHQLHAADWGVTLETAREVPEATAFCGIRAKRIDLSGAPGDVNCFEVEIEQSFEDVFSIIYRVRPKGVSAAGTLRVEVSKTAPPLDRTAPVYAVISPDEVFPLIP